MPKYIDEYIIAHVDKGAVYPSAFIWHRRLYRVSEVLSWWREPAAWWEGEPMRILVRVADVTVFNDVQAKCGSVLFRCGWLEVRGKIQRRGPKSLSIIADEVSALKANAKR